MRSTVERVNYENKTKSFVESSLKGVRGKAFFQESFPRINYNLKQNN